MDDLKEIFVYILTPSTPVIVIGLLIVLVVPLLVHFLITASTPYTTLPSILLVGPTGGGKTALVTLLERGTSPVPTHTSQVSHSVELTASTDGSALSFREAAKEDAPGTHKKFLLVDTPGHGKLRNIAMGSVTGSQTLKGIVFMVDSAALEENLDATAAYLHELLLALQKRMGAGKSSRAPTPIPVLIAANKADLFTALPASLVKSRLEVEVGRMRTSRSKGLLDSGVGNDEIGSEEQDNWLGQWGSEKFSFAEMREFDTEVEVIGGSINEEKVDKWWDWIAQTI